MSRPSSSPKMTVTTRVAVAIPWNRRDLILWIFWGRRPACCLGTAPGVGVKAGRRPPGGLGLDVDENVVRLGPRDPVVHAGLLLALLEVVQCELVSDRGAHPQRG